MRIVTAITLATLTSFVWAGPTITPSTSTVRVNGFVQFSSTDTVEWSLVPGSLGSIDSNGLYTAPTYNELKNRNVWQGVPLVPDDHIYNVDITSLPVDSNSSARVSNVGAVTVGFEPYFPRNILTDQTVQSATMTFRYTTTQNGATYYFLPPPFRGVETNLYPQNYFDQDRHIIAVSTDSLIVQEVYNYYPRGLNGECTNCNAQSGVRYGPMSYQLAAYDGSTDAAGLYIAPLLLRYDELKRGEINHALRFTLANGYNYSGFTWPGTNYSAQCVTIGTCFPYGSRLRLKSSFSDSGFSPEAKTIIRALKKYGMHHSDGGLSIRIQTEAAVITDTATFRALMVEIPGSSLDFTDFEQVDMSSLMISTASGRVRVPNQYNVTPNNYAIVVATKTSDSSTTTVHIALQGITVGTYNPAWPPGIETIQTMAGMPQFQIPYWVLGSTDTRATCSMTPTLGSLTSDCLYTPPSSVVKPSSAVVTITPVVDSTYTISFPLVVYSSNGIRVDLGGKSAFISSPVIPYDSAGNYGPDVDGDYWYQEPPGAMMPWYAREDGGYPQSSWGTSVDDVGLYYTRQHGTSDGGFGAIVPNGTYTLSLLFGRDDGTTNTLQSIESQNEVLISSTAFASFIGSTAYSPKILTYSVEVTDNRFYFALRFPDNSKFVLLNAFSLELNSLSENPTQNIPRVFRGWGTLRGRGQVR